MSITCVQFIGRQEIITGNIGGQVRIYDLRANKKSVRSLCDFNEVSGVKSLAQHPTQNHMLLIGYQSGKMSLQDLRQMSSTMATSSPVPIAYLPHQHGGINELYFHRVNPDNFFTGSQNGELVHWMPAEPTDDVEMIQRKC